MTSISDFLDAHAHEPALAAQLLEMARTGLAEHQERLREVFGADRGAVAPEGGNADRGAVAPKGGNSDATQDFFAVARTESHKIANVTSALRREDLSRLANELESAARAGDEGACREAWSRLDPEIGRLRKAVESAGEQSVGAKSAEEQPSSDDSSQKPSV